MNQKPTVIWEMTRACDLHCRHCPNPPGHEGDPGELTTFQAYSLVNQVSHLRPARFVMSGGDPLMRPDVYELVDHARRRALRPALVLSPTANVTSEAILRLRRNGLDRVIVSLDGATAGRHDELCAVPGAFEASLQIIAIVLDSGIDVEVNTLVSCDNIGDLRAIHERIEDLGIIAWNIHLPVARPGLVLPLTAVETAQVQTVVEALRARGAAEIRVIDSSVPTVFVSCEGFVRSGELARENAGDLRARTLAAICRPSTHLATLRMAT